MKTFSIPEMEIVVFQVEDVITTSGELGENEFPPI